MENYIDMKKGLLLLAVTCALSFTGCDKEEVKVEKGDFALHNSDNEKSENVRIYEDIVEDIDFSKQHIYVEMRDKFTVNADVTNDIPEELGIYEYDMLSDAYTKEHKEQDEFVKLVDEYYGEDVTWTYEEAEARAKEEGKEEIDYSMVNITYNDSCVGYGFFSNGVHFEAYDILFPYYESDYDETMIEEVIDKFTKHFEDFMPADISSDYRCIHFNEEYWAKVSEKFGEDYEGLRYGDKDCYLIRLYAEVENGVYNENEIQMQYESIDEEAVADGFVKDVGSISNYGCRSSYVDMLLDENGEMIGFELSDGMRIGECIRVEEVIDTETVLGMVYELYAPYPMYKQITIREIKLKYIPVLGNEVDDNGYRAAWLEPIWSVKFTKDDECYHSTIVFSAVTGELLEREN